MEFLAALFYKAQRQRDRSPVSEAPPAGNNIGHNETVSERAEEEEEENSASCLTVEELIERSPLSPHLEEELRTFFAAYAPPTIAQEEEKGSLSSSSSSSLSDGQTSLPLPPLVSE